MSRYRDELAAARARIAALEDEVDELREEDQEDEPRAATAADDGARPAGSRPAEQRASSSDRARALSLSWNDAVCVTTDLQGNLYLLAQQIQHRWDPDEVETRTRKLLAVWSLDSELNLRWIRHDLPVHHKTARLAVGGDLLLVGASDSDRCWLLATDDGSTRHDLGADDATSITLRNAAGAVMLHDGSWLILRGKELQRYAHDGTVSLDDDIDALPASGLAISATPGGSVLLMDRQQLTCCAFDGHRLEQCWSCAHGADLRATARPQVGADAQGDAIVLTGTQVRLVRADGQAVSAVLEHGRDERPRQDSALGVQPDGTFWLLSHAPNAPEAERYRGDGERLRTQRGTDESYRRFHMRHLKQHTDQVQARFQAPMAQQFGDAPSLVTEQRSQQRLAAVMGVVIAVAVIGAVFAFAMC